MELGFAQKKGGRVLALEKNTQVDAKPPLLRYLRKEERVAMASEAVKVIVRCRPMNEREHKLNCDVSFCAAFP